MHQEGTGVPGGGGSGGGNYYQQDNYQGEEYYLIGTTNDGAYGQATIVPDISQQHLNFYPIPPAPQHAAAPLDSYHINPTSYVLH